jgi:phage terminase large subunit GpA-like protein
VSSWADRYRILSSKDSAEPGPWRTGRTPYLREIMDCLSPSSPVETVVFMKGSQVGATAMGLNWLGFIVHQAPGPVLAVQPTIEMARRFSRQRLDPLVIGTPAIAGLISEPR